ncbi:MULTISPECIES: HAD family hydrolase [Gemella]|uniref:HAD family hydrolase n=1 Tax=Gemella TaxID=1378 RepID=UPI000767F12F|nr:MULTISPECIES: HAD family hydrolase [Gemella]AME09898.1 haloacid dehalogenase [Gemella sp. oral taxon 928]
MFGDIKNIIFDLDNTLYHFSSIWKESNERTFNYFGYNNFINYEDFFLKYKEVNNELIKKIRSGELRFKELRFERLITTFEKFEISLTNDDCKVYYEKQFEFINDLIVPDIELIDKIKDLKRQYNLVILTNGKALEQRQKIKKLGLENLFKLYISEETHISKPKPEAFINILEENDFLPEETLMIGDSIFYDIKPAKKLGCRTCLIDRRWHFDDEGKNLNYDGYKADDVKIVLDNLLKKI